MADPASHSSEPSHTLDSGNAVPMGLLGGMVIPCAMLLLASLPDAMFPPILKGLLVDRYGVGLNAAFWFMSVNLLGILLTLPALPWLRRRWSPAGLIGTAAVLNGVLYGLMSLPLGLTWTLVLRALEGGPDLIVLAGVLALISRGGEEDQRGLRFGLAGTVMMFALFAGLLVGGWAGSHGPGVVFGIATGECLLLATLAFAGRRRLPRSGIGVRREVRPAGLRRRYPIWPAMVMMFSDRGLAAGLSIAGALYMETVLDLPTRLASGLLAMTIFLVAICNGPLGIIADRFGLLRIRIVTALLYGLCFMGIALTVVMPLGWLILVLGLMGVAGAGLIPTAFSLGARSGGGTTDMGLLQAAGQWGFFTAMVVGGLIVSDSTSGDDVSLGTWNLLFVSYGVVYLVLNAVAILGVLWRKFAPSPVDLSGSGST